MAPAGARKTERDGPDPEAKTEAEVTEKMDAVAEELTNAEGGTPQKDSNVELRKSGSPDSEELRATREELTARGEGAQPDAEAPSSKVQAPEKAQKENAEEAKAADDGGEGEGVKSPLYYGCFRILSDESG